MAKFTPICSASATSSASTARQAENFPYPNATPDPISTGTTAAGSVLTRVPATHSRALATGRSYAGGAGEEAGDSWVCSRSTGTLTPMSRLERLPSGAQPAEVRNPILDSSPDSAQV